MKQRRQGSSQLFLCISKMCDGIRRPHCLNYKARPEPAVRKSWAPEGMVELSDNQQPVPSAAETHWPHTPTRLPRAGAENTSLPVNPELEPQTASMCQAIQQRLQLSWARPPGPQVLRYPLAGWRREEAPSLASEPGQLGGLPRGEPWTLPPLLLRGASLLWMTVLQ